MNLDPLPVDYHDSQLSSPPPPPPANRYHAGTARTSINSNTNNNPCSPLTEDFRDFSSLMDVFEFYPPMEVTTAGDQHDNIDPTTSEVFQWDSMDNASHQLVQEELNKNDLSPIPYRYDALATPPSAPASSPESSFRSRRRDISEYEDRDDGIQPSPHKRHRTTDYFNWDRTHDVNDSFISSLVSDVKVTCPTEATTANRHAGAQEAGDEDDASVGDEETPSFSSFQIDRWDERFKELIQYKEIHGHCCIPNTSKSEFQLGQWIKRQRYQYRLKKSGKFSTLTDERMKALDQLGFVWDLHTTIWEERLADLYAFREIHGHCKVPLRYPQNPDLAIWAKCQRRHYREYVACIKSGKTWKSNTMTEERITKLKQAGFVFSNRERRV